MCWDSLRAGDRDAAAAVGGASEAPRAIGVAAQWAVVGEIDAQGAAPDETAVECLDGRLGLGWIGHGDECEAFGSAALAVGDEAHIADAAMDTEQVVDVVAGGCEWQVSDEDVQELSSYVGEWGKVRILDESPRSLQPSTNHEAVIASDQSGSWATSLTQVYPVRPVLGPAG